MPNVENDLMAKLKSGDLAAFKRFYIDHHPRLFAFSKKIIDDKETAKDILQEVFFEFWQQRNIIDIKVSVQSYLFKMLHNKCLNHLRTLKIHQKYVAHSEIKLKEAELAFFNNDTDGHTSIFFLELELLLEKSIASLPNSCRQIFLLSRKEGLGNKEVAERLNISVRTVENQIYRALKIIKEDLKDYLPLLPYIFAKLFHPFN
jgi:RNA polymerase sigma-70 factor, ECF subfamily